VYNQYIAIRQYITELKKRGLNIMTESTCKDRIEAELKNRINDLTLLWNDYQNGIENNPDIGNLNEYGLCFDYVAPNTFKDQRKGYFRYQLSWGGPSDEFRFYTTQEVKRNRYNDNIHVTFTLTAVDYVFLDWFDGAKTRLTGKKLELLTELFAWFEDSLEYEYNKAAED
jgi:hypothetical protein